MTLMDTAQLLGNFGEFVGAIAVAGTLIFVGLEIHKARKLSMVDGAESRLDSWNDWTRLLLSNPDLTDVYLRGSEDMGELHTQELFVFNQLMIFHYTILLRMFIRGRELKDRESLEGARGILRDLFSDQPTAADWWRRYRNGYRASFREFVDGVLREHEELTT
jgi:hypothetical protein